MSQTEQGGDTFTYDEWTAWDYAVWYAGRVILTGEREPNLEPEAAGEWRANHHHFVSLFEEAFSADFETWLGQAIETRRCVVPSGDLA